MGALSPFTPYEICYAPGFGFNIHSLDKVIILYINYINALCKHTPGKSSSLFNAFTQLGLSKIYFVTWLLQSFIYKCNMYCCCLWFVMMLLLLHIIADLKTDFLNCIFRFYRLKYTFFAFIIKNLHNWFLFMLFWSFLPYLAVTNKLSNTC